MKDDNRSRLRFVGRYLIAAATIPVGVVCGVGGLLQNYKRKVTGFQRRTQPDGPPAEAERS